MANKSFWAGMLVLVFGMTVVGCESLQKMFNSNDSTSKDSTSKDSTSKPSTSKDATSKDSTSTASTSKPSTSGVNSALNGTWVADNEEITLSNGDFEITVGGRRCMKGTYTTSGSNISLTVTHIHGGYTKFAVAGLSNKWYSRKDFRTQYRANEKQLNEIFPTFDGTYTSTKLTLKYQDTTTTYTKK